MPPEQREDLPIIMRNFSNGVVQDSVVDEYLAPKDSVSLAINLHFDRLGSTQLRPGVTILGSQIDAGDAILGLHQFLDQGTGTDNRLLAVVNTALYYLSGGTWTSKRTGLTAQKKARFTNFLDFVWMVNGADATAIWDGASANSFITTGNAASAPIGFFIENFKSRVWILNNPSNPSRAYYSTLPDPSTGLVSWEGDYIDISPGDGEDITGAKKFGKILWMFKNNYMYPIFSINETEPDPSINVGTYSHESISVAKDGMYWHHPTGIYRMRKGESQPMEISRPVDDVIKNILRTNYDLISSWVDRDHVYFSVGNVTLDNGLIITNCVLRWTISTETWTIYSYAHSFTCGAQYDTGSALAQVVGDSDGKVHTFNSGLSDNGIEIHYQLETQWTNILGLRSETKVINKIAGVHENAAGGKVGFRKDKDNISEIKALGSLKEPETMFNNIRDMKGKRFKMNLSGSSKGTPFTFQGFEILEYKNEGIIE